VIDLRPPDGLWLLVGHKPAVSGPARASHLPWEATSGEAVGTASRVVAGGRYQAADRRAI